MLERINPTTTQAWFVLKKHFEEEMNRKHMKDLFQNDGARFSKYSIQTGKILFDYSKNIISDKTMQLLFQLAKECSLGNAINAQFEGKAINETEGKLMDVNESFKTLTGSGVERTESSLSLLKEGFAGFSDNSGMDSLRTLAGDATAATAIAGYNKQMGNECITYLNNTFVLVSSLDSYHLYGNITYAQSKELRAFGDTKTSLTMADTNLKDVYNISYMEQVRFSALMNLAISLSLIIAVTVTLILPLENYPYVRKVILIIGGLFALISITLYILETTTRVHTKPKQIYWSAADTKQLESTS
mgnify:CR=1 FL=1